MQGLYLCDDCYQKWREQQNHVGHKQAKMESMGKEAVNVGKDAVKTAFIWTMAGAITQVMRDTLKKLSGKKA